MNYNLSICCINGWIYGLICDDKAVLLGYLKLYDHEGSSISLVLKEEGKEYKVFYSDDVYKKLQGA